MAKFALEITEEVTYGNATYSSAAQFTSHKLIPGLYPLEHEVKKFVGLDKGNLSTNVDNYLMLSSYNGVTAKGFVPGERHSLRLEWYTYEVKEDAEVKLGTTSIGHFRKIAD